MGVFDIFLVIVTTACIVGFAILLRQNMKMRERINAMCDEAEHLKAEYEATPTLLTSNVKDAFLRRLIAASSSTDINKAAFGIINTILSEPGLRIHYVSLMLWLDSRKQMVLLGTNVNKKYGKALLEHVNEITRKIFDNNLAAHVLDSATGSLSYPTARERNVCFEYYIPLYQGNQLIGSILIESSDIRSKAMLDLTFFRLIVENISLVLYNITLMQKVLQQANTDNLTKLYNRTYMYTYMDNLRANNTEYTIVMSDIDFFKKCNDTYGHAVGDLVLEHVAKCLMQAVRAGFDGAFRFGGEEFIMVFREAGMDLAAQRAEQLRQYIEKTPVVYDNEGHTLNITLSLGVYQAKGTEDINSSMKKADKCLYYAKEHGRNQVVKYRPELFDEDGVPASMKTDGVGMQVRSDLIKRQV